MPRIFVYVSTIGFAAGLIAGEYFSVSWPVIFALMVMMIAMVWTRRGMKVLVFAIFALLGMFRIQTDIQRLDNATESLVRTERPVTGLVTRVSESYGRQSIDATHLTGLGLVQGAGGHVTSGEILPIKPGQYVRIECRWAALPPDHIRRGQSQGLLAECRYPTRLERIGSGSDWRARLARARGSVVTRIQHQYHHPQSDLLAGILLGVQETMTADLRQDFRATGTSHIVALSGFNVTIIITILSGTLAALIGRRPALWPTLGLITCFVIMTGASASVTRAAVMAVIVMLGQHLGRPVAMSRILAYTFVVMTAVNPLILRYDLGFQLSFLATVGLVYVSPGLTSRLPWIPEALEIRNNLTSTLAAMAATEPLLLWTFGRFSIVAPVVNLAVLPFIPLIMAMGAIALIVPLAIPVTDAFLRLVLWMITTAGSWSFAQVAMPWWVAGGLATLAAVVVIRSWYETVSETLRPD